jgi:hypothetical protein
MSNDLTKYLNTSSLPAIDDAILAAALSEAADDATTGAGAGTSDYLSFSGKSGLYSLGRDKEPVDPEQLYIVEPHTFVAGWTCWKNSKPIDRIKWDVLKTKEQAVSKEMLTEHGPYRESSGEGWQQMLGFGAIACDKKNSQIEFSSTSKSGRNSIADLMKEIGLRASAGEPSLPLIYFEAESFVAQGNTNHKPVLPRESWVTRASAAAYLAGDMSMSELVDGLKPKKKVAKKAAKKKRK